MDQDIDENILLNIPPAFDDNNATPEAMLLFKLVCDKCLCHTNTKDKVFPGDITKTPISKKGRPVSVQ
jgi:hypothetical protein